MDDVTQNVHRHAAATASTTVSLGGGDTHLLYQATLQSTPEPYNTPKSLI
jgi:hypothetical protein